MSETIPFFSIILPTHNRANFLPIAIQSVLSQTFKEFELIIIDDASTDNTEELVKNFQKNDSRIIYLKNEKNIERSASRNKGIDHAKGQYICFLDSDDYYLENHLEVLYSEINKRNNPVALLFTHTFAEQNGIRTKCDSQKAKLPKNNALLILDSEFYINNVTVKKEVLIENKFNNQIIIGEDNELWLRIAAEGYDVIPINSFTTVFTKHCDNSTNFKYNYGQLKLEGLKIRYKNFKLKKLLPNHIIKNQYSECYFLMAIFYHQQGNFFKMVESVIISMILSPFSNNWKAKLLLLFSKHKNIKK